MDGTGLVTVASRHSVPETIVRLRRAVEEHGLLVFAHVDHGAGAASVGEKLRPTELLLVGHPRGGTPLMQDRQTAGLDLPIHFLVWQDADGTTQLTFNDAAWLAEGTGDGWQIGSDISAYLGVAHGWLYMLFLIAAFLLSRRAEWPNGFTLVTLAMGTVPILSFWSEHRATRRVKDEYAAELV